MKVLPSKSSHKLPPGSAKLRFCGVVCQEIAFSLVVFIKCFGRSEKKSVRKPIGALIALTWKRDRRATSQEVPDTPGNRRRLS